MFNIYRMAILHLRFLAVTSKMVKEQRKKKKNDKQNMQIVYDGCSFEV